MRATIATPTPMPACAPVDNPDFGSVLGVGEPVEVIAGWAVVAEGLAVPLLLEDVELLIEDVLVENNVRSFCWNSTTTGWPHIEIGPEIAVVVKSVSLARARTVVAPLDSG
jgi:hypothetical protein